jgi:hypothetical protein
MMRSRCDFDESIAQPFTRVLHDELRQIRRRRLKLFGVKQPPAPTPPLDGRASKAGEQSSAESKRLAADYAAAHMTRPLGVAFSGGGIRSATFNLGVLQGFSQLGLLPYIDYLSTVSGGGYIGSWLHGVISNQSKGDPQNAAVLLSPHDHPAPGPSSTDPVTFLRKYSNYLAPSPGLFSADTWVIALIWLRNVLLNQLILLPAIAAVLLLPFLCVYMKQMRIEHEAYTRLIWLAVGAGSVDGFFVAELLMYRNLRAVVRQTFPQADDHGTAHRDAAQRKRIAEGRLADDEIAERRSGMIAPALFTSAMLLGCSTLAAPGGSNYGLGMAILVAMFWLFGSFQAHGGFLEYYEHRRSNAATRRRAAIEARVLMSLMVSIAAASTSFLLAVILFGIHWSSPWQQLTIAPPLVCMSVLAGGTLHTGLMGADYPDAGREWMARVGAQLAILCAAWVTAFVLAIYSPTWFAWLLGNYAAAGITVIGGWMATTIGGVLAGRSPNTDGRNESRGADWLGALTETAPTVFMVGYLLAIAFGVHVAMRRAVPVPRAPATVAGQMDPIRLAEGWLTDRLRPAAEFASQSDEVLGSNPGARLIAVSEFLVVLTVVFIAASRRVNINEFSMHHFYKNRLVRCYLGASNTRKRRPNPFTGFDPNDDFALSSLVPSADVPYYGPYAIITAALNLNAGSELAQQERKAASFVFTPMYCGFTPSTSESDTEEAKRDPNLDEYAYRLTRATSTGDGTPERRRAKGYSDPKGPALGTAMAISGAAANPNSGYHTSGPMAFLLTVFDARLGWWLGNPRDLDASWRPGPQFALKYLFSELLALTSARSSFVNLSDGGHFENLGLYELVRRRCRYIIVCDAEEDPGLSFESLGSAVRKCRADFGVEIDINPDPIRVVKDTGYSKAHCVVGRITYPEVERGRAHAMCTGNDVASDRMHGWILYLKSSLTGDESADVAEYRSRHAAFPHQSTGDQFFSESQFESYRRLGLHIVLDAFEDVLPYDFRAPGMRELVTPFQQLSQRWFALTPPSEEAAGRLADDYSRLMSALRTEAALRGLVPELTEGVTAVRRLPKQGTAPERLFLLEVIQLMENVYVEFHLQYRANRSNPGCAGWMKMLRFWRNSAVLTEVWNDVEDSYNPRFKQFMNTVVAENTDVKPRP